MAEPVVVIAAHPDDEVLGCGGTLARMAKEGRSVHVFLLADGETSRGESERPRIAARRTAASQACDILGCATLDVHDLPDNRLDRIDLLDIVQRIESVIARYQPSTVLTHHAGDVNIDHRIVHAAMLAACRPLPGRSVRELLFFEIPSSTEWMPPGSGEPFVPNCFVDVSATLPLKLKALQAYESELRPFPHPRSARAVEALARWRGAAAGMEAAEAFMLGRRLVV